jgi:hypothetical protein
VLLRFLILFMLTSSLWGTTFKEVSMEDQMDEADGIVLGHYLKSRSVKLDDGVIATQMIFKLKKEWGLQSELFGMDEIIVHYPGGSIGDETVKIQGVPQFMMGEKVALFTKNVAGRFWGLNLGLGTFKVINYGTETLLINSIFPQDTKVSQVKLEDFERKVRRIKGSNLKIVMSPQYFEDEEGRIPASIEEGKKRAVASTTEAEDNKDEQPSPSTFWLITLLALAGALSRLLKEKDAR